MPASPGLQSHAERRPSGWDADGEEEVGTGEQEGGKGPEGHIGGGDAEVDREGGREDDDDDDDESPSKRQRREGVGSVTRDLSMSMLQESQ